jgi:hypothetical protein
VSGSVCLLPAPNGMTWLDAAAPGPFSIVASPNASGFVQAATSDFDGSCRKLTQPNGVSQHG